jgi:hypothetical protein
MYSFVWEGQRYLSHHIADGPHPLGDTFTLDIDQVPQQFAHLGADATFASGTHRFAATYDTPAVRQSYADARRLSRGE